jgi:hypothetical protein
MVSPENVASEMENPPKRRQKKTFGIKKGTLKIQLKYTRAQLG